MKKLLVLMMALVMTVSLAACGGESEAPPTEPPTAAEDQVADEQAKADKDFHSFKGS